MKQTFFSSIFKAVVVVIFLVLITHSVVNPVFAQIKSTDPDVVTATQKDAKTPEFGAADDLPTGLTNPAIPKKLGNDYTKAKSGGTFAYYFVYIWRVMIVIGGLLVVINFISGAIDWITAGGEKGKVESARNKITGSVVGMIVLAGSFAAIQLAGNLLQINILNPTITTPETGGAVLQNATNPPKN